MHNQSIPGHFSPSTWPGYEARYVSAPMPGYKARYTSILYRALAFNSSALVPGVGNQRKEAPNYLLVLP